MSQANKIWAVLLAISSSFYAFAQAPNFAWQRTWNASQAVQCREIAYDNNGDVYVGGTFRSTLDMDPGSAEVKVTAVGTYNGYLVKLDQDGSYLWSITYPVELSITGLVIAASGDILVAGRFGGEVDFDPGDGVTTLMPNGLTDAFLARYTAAGALVWAKSFGNELNNGVLSLAEAPDGSIYIGGDYMNSTDFDPGLGETILTTGLNISDGYVSKFNAEGDFLSVEPFPVTEFGEVNIVRTDLEGNLFVVGHFSGTMTFDPEGQAQEFTSEGTDMFIAKYTNAGAFVWAKRSDGASNITMGNLDIDQQGQLYIIGTFTGVGDFDPGPGVVQLEDSLRRGDIFLMKLNNDGGLIWAKQFGVPESPELGSDVSVDEDANIYITGYVVGAVDFDLSENEVLLPALGLGDAFALKLDADAGFIWATRFGNNQNDAGNRILPHPDGSVYLSGNRLPAGDSPHSYGFLYKYAVSTLSVGSDLRPIEGINIFPNPSEGLYHMDSPAILETIYLSDLAGRVLSTYTPHSTSTSIDLGGFPSGVYVLHVLSANAAYAKRIIKE